MLAKTLADILWRIGTSESDRNNTVNPKYLQECKEKSIYTVDDTVNPASESDSLTSNRIANQEFAYDASATKHTPGAVFPDVTPTNSGNPIAELSRSSSLGSSCSTDTMRPTDEEDQNVVVRVVRPTRKVVRMSPSCYRTTFGCGVKDFITENVSIFRHLDIFNTYRFLCIMRLPTFKNSR